MKKIFKNKIVNKIILAGLVTTSIPFNLVASTQKEIKTQPLMQIDFTTPLKVSASSDIAKIDEMNKKLKTALNLIGVDIAKFIAGGLVVGSALVLYAAALGMAIGIATGGASAAATAASVAGGGAAGFAALTASTTTTSSILSFASAGALHSSLALSSAASSLALSSGLAGGAIAGGAVGTGVAAGATGIGALAATTQTLIAQALATSVIRKKAFSYIILLPFTHKAISKLKDLPEAITIAKKLDESEKASPGTLTQEQKFILDTFKKKLANKTVIGITRAFIEAKAIDDIVIETINKNPDIAGETQNQKATNVLRKHIWWSWQLSNYEAALKYGKLKGISLAKAKLDKNIKMGQLKRLHKKYPGLKDLVEPIAAFAQAIEQIRGNYK